MTYNLHFESVIFCLVLSTVSSHLYRNKSCHSRDMESPRMYLLTTQYLPSNFKVGGKLKRVTCVTFGTPKPDIEIFQTRLILFNIYCMSSNKEPRNFIKTSIVFLIHFLMLLLIHERQRGTYAITLIFTQQTIFSKSYDFVTGSIT